MPDVVYAPGRAVLVATDRAVILLPTAVSWETADRLLEVLRSAVDPLQGTITTLCDGPIDFGRLPAFALRVRLDADDRLLLRGAISAEVDGVEQAGGGSGSWSEVAVPLACRVTLSIAGEVASDDLLPLREGVVRADRVVVRPLGVPHDEREAEPSAEPAVAAGPVPQPDDYVHLFRTSDEQEASAEPALEAAVVPTPEVADLEGAAVAQRPIEVDLGHIRGTLPMGDHDGRTVRAPGVGPDAPWGIELSTGERIALGPRIVIGRRPIAPVSEEEHDVRLVTVPSVKSDISRNHVEIAGRNGVVDVRDLRSTNGTVLVRDGARTRLDADSPVAVRAGDVLDIGDGITVHFVVDR